MYASLSFASPLPSCPLPSPPPSLRSFSLLPPSQCAGLVTRLQRPPIQPVPNQPSLSSMFGDKWEIDKKDLQLGKELSSGQFGVCPTHSCDFTLLSHVLPAFTTPSHLWEWREGGKICITHTLHSHHTLTHSTLPICSVSPPCFTLFTQCTFCTL